MSVPVDQQEQLAPPMGISEQVNTSSQSHHGSIGSVIAVVVVIAVLGFIAGMVGRICSGRRVRGLGQYDFESWVERKCSSCIDGRITPPPPPPPPPSSINTTTTSTSSSTDSVPVAADPIGIPDEEMKETE